MKAVTKVFAGAGVLALTAGAFAAPAAAQYPGYGYGNQGNVIGQVLDTVLGAQRYGQGAYGYANDQALIGRCAAAVEQRINRDYGYRYGSQYGNPYGGYNQYAQGGARVVGITRVERRSSSTTRVRGVATAMAGQTGYGQYGNPYGGYQQPYGGYQQPYGQQYGYAQQGELTFKCDIDYRGYVRDIDLERNRNAYRRY